MTICKHRAQLSFVHPLPHGTSTSAPNPGPIQGQGQLAVHSGGAREAAEGQLSVFSWFYPHKNSAIPAGSTFRRCPAVLLEQCSAFPIMPREGSWLVSFPPCKAVPVLHRCLEYLSLVFEKGSTTAIPFLCLESHCTGSGPGLQSTRGAVTCFITWP